MVSKIGDAGETLEPGDRQGLRQLAATLKDVSSVGRDTYQLSSREDQARCIVNLGFLQSFADDPLVGESKTPVSEAIIDRRTPGTSQSIVPG